MILRIICIIFLLSSSAWARMGPIVTGGGMAGGGCAVASEILRPNGDFSTQWDQSSGYANLINDQSDSTYTTTSTGYELLSVSLEDVVNTTCTITGVTIYARAMVNTGSAQARGSLRIGGSGYNATDTNLPTGSISQMNFTQWANNPATSSAWGYTAINDLQVMFSSRGLSAQTLTLAELWVVVSYAQ